MKHVVLIDRVDNYLEVAESLAKEANRLKYNFPQELCLLFKCGDSEEYVSSLIYRYESLVKYKIMWILTV